MVPERRDTAPVSRMSSLWDRGATAGVVCLAATGLNAIGGDMALTRRGGVLLLVVAVGFAMALSVGVAESAPTKRIYACVTAKHKTLNLTAKAKVCPRGQQRVSWAVAGTSGPRGAKGARGARGSAGTPGAVGERGAAGSQGAAGTAGAAGAAGAAGERGATGAQGVSGTTGPQGATGSVDPAALAAIEARLDALQGRVDDLEDENAALTALLAGVTRSSDGSTLRFSGMNVELVNGTGSPTGINGLGNLIVGYNDAIGTPTTTGSHNISVGFANSFTAWSGIVAGVGNTSSNAYAVAFGSGNTASGGFATVTGGRNNHATGNWASVSGGSLNTAAGDDSSVSGGMLNVATGWRSSLLGGMEVTLPGMEAIYPPAPTVP